MIKIVKIFSLIILLSSCAMLDEFTNNRATASKDNVDAYEKAKIYSKEFPVTKEVVDTAFVKKFNETVCVGMNKLQCIEKYNLMVHNRMHSYYKVATVDLSMKFCDTYPIECSDVSMIETWYILSYNQYVDNLKRHNLPPP